MANYEYIIASLPALAPDWKPGDPGFFGNCISWIKSQLSGSDIKTVDRLLGGYEEANLNREYYEGSLGHGNRFIREFAAFDLNLRNAKARFLNKAFGLPEKNDTIDIDTGEFKEKAKAEEVLARQDLLSREHGLDSLTWDKINELTLFDYFDLDAVLGYIAKLKIIDRWASLDPETGRDMFHNLVEEVRGNYKGVNENTRYED